MSRWIWRAVAGVWVLVGALALPMLYLLWRSNPTDDVDYGPMAQVFTVALLGWVAIAVALLVGWLLYKSAKKEAALRAPDRERSRV